MALLHLRFECELFVIPWPCTHLLFLALTRALQQGDLGWVSNSILMAVSMQVSVKACQCISLLLGGWTLMTRTLVHTWEECLIPLLWRMGGQ